MASETVKIYVKDQDSIPITGVLIRVFDSSGSVYNSQNYTTLVSGRAVADLTLLGGSPINYTIRMSKVGVAFDGNEGDASKTPQLISVYSPPEDAPNGTNNFEVIGQTFTLPVATNPRLCRASGFFKDAGGRCLPGLDITFINQFRPAIVDGYGVMGAKLDLRTDEGGYVTLDLYRGAEYHVLVQGIEAAGVDYTGAIIFERDIVVPNRSSVSLLDLLFPIVKEITWSPDTISMAVGDFVDVIPTVLTTDFRTLSGTALQDVLYTIDDESIASVSPLEDKLVILGISSGITNLLVTRIDQSIVVIPSTDIISQSFIITVI